MLKLKDRHANQPNDQVHGGPKRHLRRFRRRLRRLRRRNHQPYEQQQQPPLDGNLQQIIHVWLASNGNPVVQVNPTQGVNTVVVYGEPKEDDHHLPQEQQQQQMQAAPNQQQQQQQYLYELITTTIKNIKKEPFN